MSAAIHIDPKTRQVFIDSRPVALTVIEYRLISFLYKHRNSVCTREEIWHEVWGSDPAYDTGILDVHIHSLRRKLNLKDAGTLQTIRGVGYILHSTSPAFGQELDWTRLFTSFMPDRVRSCNLPDFFQSLHDDYASAWETGGITVQWHLSPFVSDILTDPPTLRAVFDAVLPLISRQAASLTFSSVLTLHEFVIRVEARTCGTVSPSAPFSDPDDRQSLLAAQRFAALLGMAFRTETDRQLCAFSLSVPMKK